MPKKKIGYFPFTKGIYKDMYQTKLWTMRQYAGFSSVKESNKRFLCNENYIKKNNCFKCYYSIYFC